MQAVMVSSWTHSSGRRPWENDNQKQRVRGSKEGCSGVSKRFPDHSAESKSKEVYCTISTVRVSQDPGDTGVTYWGR